MKVFLWYHAPALLYALSYLSGLYFAFGYLQAILFLPLIIISKREQMLILTLIFLLPLPLLQHRYLEKSTGLFTLSSVHFNHGWIYKGHLERVPCSFFSKKAYVGKNRFHLEGTWEEKRFICKKIEPLPGGFSLPWWRYKTKKALRAWVESHFRHERSSLFISALLTGELHNQEMKKEFTRLGLMHLLAISGFHFSLLVFTLHLFLQYLLPRKVELLLTFSLMSFYALFIGYCPSVIRAWIFMTLYLGGQFLERKIFFLNTLGSSLCIILLFDPHSALTLSFQLSFAATFALMLFYHPLDCALQTLFPKYNLYEGSQHSYLWQLGYMSVAMLRELISLNLSIHLLVLPLLLYHFHVFYPVGLLYNLFFPLMTAVALLLLPLYPLCDAFSEALLHLTRHDFGGFYVEEMSLSLTLFWIGAVTIVGLCWQERLLRKRFNILQGFG